MSSSDVYQPIVKLLNKYNYQHIPRDSEKFQILNFRIDYSVEVLHKLIVLFRFF